VLYRKLMDSWKKKAEKGAIWVVSVIVAAWLGGLIARYLDRANPRVELASVTLAGYAGPKAEITPSESLRRAADDLPLNIPEIRKPAMSLKEWDRAAAKLKNFDTERKQAAETLTAVADILKSRPADYPKDQLRLELLRKWDESPFLTSIGERAVAREYYKKLTTSEKFKKYREHPADWKGPAQGLVEITTTRYRNLSELKSSEKASPRQKAMTAIRNVHNRLWIYLDRDLLLDFLETMRNDIDEAESIIKDFLLTMDQEREAFDPERVNVQLVISNLGFTPAVFASVAYLTLETNRGPLQIEIHAKIRGELDGASAIVVNGYKALKGHFFSKLTVREIASKYFPKTKKGGSADEDMTKQSNPLKAIYDTEVLDCSISLAQKIEPSGHEIITVKRAGAFGSNANEKLMKSLRDAAAQSQ
jgi:hypothetical protein